MNDDLRNSLQNANIASVGRNKRVLTSEKALPCPKLRICVVLVSCDKYMHHTADFTHSICQLKFALTRYQLQDDVIHPNSFNWYLNKFNLGLQAIYPIWKYRACYLLNSGAIYPLVSFVTSSLGLQEEPQTAHPMSLTWVSHTAASRLTGQ